MSESANGHRQVVDNAASEIGDWELGEFVTIVGPEGGIGYCSSLLDEGVEGEFRFWLEAMRAYAMGEVEEVEASRVRMGEIFVNGGLAEMTPVAKWAADLEVEQGIEEAPSREEWFSLGSMVKRVFGKLCDSQGWDCDALWETGQVYARVDMPEGLTLGDFYAGAQVENKGGFYYVGRMFGDLSRFLKEKTWMRIGPKDEIKSIGLVKDCSDDVCVLNVALKPWDKHGLNLGNNVVDFEHKEGRKYDNRVYVSNEYRIHHLRWQSMNEFLLKKGIDQLAKLAEIGILDPECDVKVVSLNHPVRASNGK